MNLVCIYPVPNYNSLHINRNEYAYLYINHIYIYTFTYALYTHENILQIIHIYAYMFINNIWHCFILFKIGISGITLYIILWNVFLSLNLVFLRLVRLKHIAEELAKLQGRAQFSRLPSRPKTSDASHTTGVPRATITPDHLATNSGVPEIPSRLIIH